MSAAPDAAAGLAAWQQVYSVLTSPRCINCHTATGYPQQGDDRHRHFANVVRGPDGKGVPALQCVTCHQESNADSTGVPGGRGWHLAPLSMRWQGPSEKVMDAAPKPAGPEATWSSAGQTLRLTKALAEANRARFRITSTPDEGSLFELSFTGRPDGTE